MPFSPYWSESIVSLTMKFDVSCGFCVVMGFLVCFCRYFYKFPSTPSFLRGFSWMATEFCQILFLHLLIWSLIFLLLTVNIVYYWLTFKYWMGLVYWNQTHLVIVVLMGHVIIFVYCLIFLNLFLNVFTSKYMRDIVI